MFKSLLQTIPSISGNFTLACKLNNFEYNKNHEYVSYINDALLMPLDNNYNLTKDVTINLINGKYEYDIMKYFKEISSYFYSDTYLKNNNIFEVYSEDKLFNLPDNRDKNFEFGCKHISYNKYKYQYQFFAPIYINNVDDLPDEFIIEIYNNTTSLIKKIRIPINIKSSKNKLKIYLTKFINKIQNNIPIVWNFKDNKIIYKNVIDCKNGGLINFTSYNVVQNADNHQTIINDIDNLICHNYSSNNIIMSECIPLSFIFNINDLLSENDYYYYYFNQFSILGYYIKDGIKCNYYNFSTNYHFNYFPYSIYDNLSNDFNHKLFNLFDNNVIYSLKEGTNYKLYYQNTFKNKYCQWKLYESDSYIINLNTVFTYNHISNKFPIFKNILNNNLKGLFSNSTLYLPINNFINYYTINEQKQYNLLLNNNYSNWYTIDKNLNDNYILKNYKSICYSVNNNSTFINGIKYYIGDTNIKYFNIFLNPIIEDYNEDLILGNVILERKVTNLGLSYYNYISENNEYYQPCQIDDNNSDTDIVYVKYNMSKKYIESNRNLVNGLIQDLYHNLFKDDNDELFADLANLYKIFNLVINPDSNLFNKDLHHKQINNIKNYFIDNVSVIFDLYFPDIVGYEKLNISIYNLDQNQLYKLFNKDKNLMNNIYFSLPNKKEKQNLYYSLINNLIDYEYLVTNNITLFKKKPFIEINNIDQLYINLFGEDGLYTNLYNKYYNIGQTITNDQQVINTFIDSLALWLKKDNKSDNLNLEFLDINDGIDLTINQLNFNSQLYLINCIQNENFINTVVINFLYDLLLILLYAALYNYLIEFINNETIIWYNYIPYYNDNNLVIDYDYYERIYNHKNYLSLYTNIQQENIGSQTLYVKVDNLEMFNYYKNYYKNSETNNSLRYKFYHKYSYIKDFVEIFDLQDLEKYIDKYIQENIFKKDNDIRIDSQYITDNKIIDIEKFLERSIIFERNNSYINLSCYVCDKLNNEYYKDYQIPVNLYIMVTGYPLLTKIEDYDSIVNPLIIYKESSEIQENTNNQKKLVNIIYNDFSTNKKSSFLYQQLMKNVNILKDSGQSKYVYQNPYNYLIKTTVKGYKDNYYPNPIYQMVNNINKYNLEYHTLKSNSKIDNDDIGYLKINYHFMLTTNSLNLYNIDNNDNFEIKSVNNTLITQDNIYHWFNSIYPYLSQDILLNVITEVNNQENYPIQIILPNNVKCKINTVVNKKKDNEKFTEIHLSNNIIKNVYLNRYFGNIDPYFILSNQYIHHTRSKIYIITNNNSNNIIADNNNVIIENLNIYKYNPIQYYDQNQVLQIKSQIEYKHFNDNYLINLPNEISFGITNNGNTIEYIISSELNKYINKEACYENFLNYVKNNYFNFKLNEDKDLLLYIFNKYNIEYIQEPEFNTVLTKVYKITYKLTLL